MSSFDDEDGGSSSSGGDEQTTSVRGESSQHGRSRSKYTEEERRRRRRTANRESARRMRAKRNEAMSILQQSVQRLEDNNKQLQNENKAILKRLQRMEMENKNLRRQTGSQKQQQQQQARSLAGAVAGSDRGEGLEQPSSGEGLHASVAEGWQGSAGQPESNQPSANQPRRPASTSPSPVGGGATSEGGLSKYSSGASKPYKRKRTTLGRPSSSLLRIRLPIERSKTTSAAAEEGTTPDAPAPDAPAAITGTGSFTHPGTPRHGTTPIRMPSDIPQATLAAHKQLSQREEQRTSSPQLGCDLGLLVHMPATGPSPLGQGALSDPSGSGPMLLLPQASFAACYSHSDVPGGSLGIPMATAAAEGVAEQTAAAGGMAGLQRVPEGSGWLAVNKGTGSSNGGAPLTTWSHPALVQPQQQQQQQMGVNSFSGYGPLQSLPHTSSSPVLIMTDPSALAAAVGERLQEYGTSGSASPKGPGLGLDWATPDELVDILLMQQPPREGSTTPGGSSDEKELDEQQQQQRQQQGWQEQQPMELEVGQQQQRQGQGQGVKLEQEEQQERVGRRFSQPVTAARSSNGAGGNSCGAFVPVAIPQPPAALHRSESLSVPAAAAAAGSEFLGPSRLVSSRSIGVKRPPSQSLLAPMPAVAAAGAGVSGPELVLPVVPTAPSAPAAAAPAAAAAVHPAGLTAADVFSKKPQGFPSGVWLSSLPGSHPMGFMQLRPGGVIIPGSAAARAIAAGGEPAAEGAGLLGAAAAAGIQAARASGDNSPQFGALSLESPPSPRLAAATAAAGEGDAGAGDGGLKATCNAYAALHAAWAAESHPATSSAAAADEALPKQQQQQEQQGGAMGSAGGVSQGLAAAPASSRGTGGPAMAPAAADPFEQWANKHAVAGKHDLLAQVSSLLNVFVPPAPSGLYGSEEKDSWHGPPPLKRRYPLKRPSKINLMGPGLAVGRGFASRAHSEPGGVNLSPTGRGMEVGEEDRFIDEIMREEELQQQLGEEGVGDLAGDGGGSVIGSSGTAVRKHRNGGGSDHRSSSGLASYLQSSGQLSRAPTRGSPVTVAGGSPARAGHSGAAAARGEGGDRQGSHRIRFAAGRKPGLPTGPAHRRQSSDVGRQRSKRGARGHAKSEPRMQASLVSSMADGCRSFASEPGPFTSPPFSCVSSGAHKGREHEVGRLSGVEDMQTDEHGTAHSLLAVNEDLEAAAARASSSPPLQWQHGHCAAPAGGVSRMHSCSLSRSAAAAVQAASPVSINAGAQKLHPLQGAAAAGPAGEPIAGVDIANAAAAGGLLSPSPSAAAAGGAGVPLLVRVKPTQEECGDGDMGDISEGFSPGIVPSLPDLLQALYNPPDKERRQRSCGEAGFSSEVTQQLQPPPQQQQQLLMVPVQQQQQQLLAQVQQQQLMVSAQQQQQQQLMVPAQEQLQQQQVQPSVQVPQQQQGQELAPGFGLFSPANTTAAASALNLEQGTFGAEGGLGATSSMLEGAPQQQQQQLQPHLTHGGWWGLHGGGMAQSGVLEAWQQQQQLQQRALLARAQVPPGKGAGLGVAFCDVL